MQELIIAFGLFLVLEGLIYALFPNGVKAAARELPSIPDQTIRIFGVVAIAAGVLVVWLVKS